MARMTYDGLETGIGCRIDRKGHGGPRGSVLSVYYECCTIEEAAKQALILLDTNREVAVFSGGRRKPRSYTSKDSLRWDFRKWLAGPAERVGP